jgi:hypothetical protein
MPCCLNSRAKDALKPEPAPTINADENCVLSIAVSLSDWTVKWRAFQRLPEELQQRRQFASPIERVAASPADCTFVKRAMPGTP